MRVLHVNCVSLCVLLLSLAACGSPTPGSKDYLKDRPAVLAPIGSKCQTSDPNHICLAIHYVTYQDQNSIPVADSQTAINNLDAVNKIYEACNIGFQIDHYEVVNPASQSLQYSEASFDNLDKIRFSYGEYSTLLAVTTGPWSGALQGMGANAWTEPPEASVFGTVMESRVADYPNILAHELGHYLNLLHVADSSNLLNPVVYTSSNQLTADQCNTARSAVSQYWPEVVRN